MAKVGQQPTRCHVLVDLSDHTRLSFSRVFFGRQASSAPGRQCNQMNLQFGSTWGQKNVGKPVDGTELWEK